MERRSTIPTNPCKDCTERHATCHAECENYIAWQALNAERLEAERKKKQAYYETYAVRVSRHIEKK